jgi:hypothetical protein
VNGLEALRSLRWILGQKSPYHAGQGVGDPWVTSLRISWGNKEAVDLSALAILGRAWICERVVEHDAEGEELVRLSEVVPRLGLLLVRVPPTVCLGRAIPLCPWGRPASVRSGA